MEIRPRLVIATRNAHKTAEIRSMIGDRYEVLDVTAFPDLPPVPETGTTFLENARLKALAISREIGGIVLSDDSGLEVDALAGAPGVWSSSYGGEEGNHPRNNERLMREMSDKNQRTARFRCTMVLAEGGMELGNFDGSVEGAIIEERRGEGGFGYDPLFVPAGYDQTFSELGDEVKNQLSHRARALTKVVEWLESRG
ncbi:RdgB/HAM1 family non-canonical purine NTP pyrophosphatase [Luteolibacter ambystomatis]|uniref:dITP/XTP pyrophosphatase n=1 Tax=Luteolibacter ambystomatis TaxID=2824561 RepID=A0A975IYV9_9BACT|nr:RdgB/HAM1 family non-canonical purine NTP pyrophosphatase [Luteolibacter ambystomatis]QUE50549.1 RdgB/HAM1 family non-canonical purine NTP pyrophosphatase [Luteolibacter ambystomatis]